MTFYDQIAKEFSQTRKNPWGEFKFFEKYIKPGQKVLDVGCGSGRLFEFLEEKGVNYTGCDSSSKMLGEAEKNFPGAKFLFGDFRDLPFEDNSFDLVFAIASFHHLMDLKDQKKGTKEIARVLKNDGMFCLTVWNLFQLKYLKFFFKNIAKRVTSGIFPFGVLVPFGKERILRSYFAFTPGRLKTVFSEDFFLVEEIFSSGKVRKKTLNCRNFCLVLKKKSLIKKAKPLRKNKFLDFIKIFVRSRGIKGEQYWNIVNLL